MALGASGLPPPAEYRMLKEELCDQGGVLKESESIRIIFVEDLATDAALAERELNKAGLRFQSIRVDTETGLVDALESFKPDLVLSDYSMPAFDGMSALYTVKRLCPDLPFIVLTGSMNEKIAVECMEAGACDYVIKEHLSRLGFAVREALERRHIRTMLDINEANLRQSEERYRTLFTNSRETMLIIDPENFTIVDANQAAGDFYGWSTAELKGMNMCAINTMERNSLKEQMRWALSLKKNGFNFKHRLANGTIRDVESYASPVKIGATTLLFSIIHDVTEQIAARHELDLLSNRLSHYLAMSPTITYSLLIAHGTTQIEWISENVERILGFSVEEAIQPEWWFNNVALGDRGKALDWIPALIDQKSYLHEYRFQKKDRSVLWLRDEMRQTSGKDDTIEVVGTMTDITNQKLAEDEIRLKSAALEALDTAMVITGRTGSIEWANKAFETLSGYGRAEALGKNPRDLVKSGKQDPSVYQSLWDTILSGTSWRGEILNKRKSGALYTEELTITPVMDQEHRIEHFIAIKRDITERTLSRLALESSLREKEVLLREIHHRVKNNMQIVSSLLCLSSNELPDPVLQGIIDELNRRIDAMAIVHERFYDSTDVSRIDFAVYLDQLACNLIEEYRVEPGRIAVIQHTESIMLDLESAIPAGLIASELVSNALKALQSLDRKESHLRISLCTEGASQVIMSVEDDGPGLPKNFDPSTSLSLGMRLIQILTEQLHGAVSFSCTGGTEAILKFPINKVSTKEQANGKR